MKKTLLIILASILTIQSYSFNLTEVVDSASFYYNKSDYENAIIFYDSIIKTGYISDKIYLNAGNCYYKTGNLANAIYYYEKSLSINSSNETAQHNLKIANSKIKNKIEQLPTAFYTKWFNGIISIISTDSWAIFSIVTFILSLIFLGSYLFSTNINIRKTGFILFIVLFIFTGFGTFFSVKTANNYTENKYAIVFDTGLVKSSPNDDSNNLFELTEGIKVEITDSLNAWYNIKLSDGKQGWIKSTGIKRI